MLDLMLTRGHLHAPFGELSFLDMIRSPINMVSLPLVPCGSCARMSANATKPATPVTSRMSAMLALKMPIKRLSVKIYSNGT